jgi:hypothetical protein
MATDVTIQSNVIGYAARPVTKAPEWHRLVAFDLLFNNLAAGIFLVAALGELAAPVVFAGLARASYPAALVLLLVDLLFLVFDLGDPWRFHHMLRVFKPSSPMSLGTWCLTIYSFPLTLAAALSLVPVVSPALEWIRKAAVILAILPALGSAVYKGVLLSTTSQPGWRDSRWLGCYLANSSLLLGCAGLSILAAALGKDDAIAVLRPALVILLLLNALPLALLLVEFRPAFIQGYKGQHLNWLGAAGIGSSTVSLFVLLAGTGALLVLASMLLLLAGSLAIRFMIVRLPHAFQGAIAIGQND